MREPRTRSGDAGHWEPLLSAVRDISVTVQYPSTVMSSAGSPRHPGMAELQRRVQEWCDAEWGGKYWPPLGNLARLMEEVGEVARLINDRYGYKPKKADEPAQELALELGDVLFTLIALANATGVDLDAAFDAVQEKYRRRDLGRYRS